MNDYSELATVYVWQKNDQHFDLGSALSVLGIVHPTREEFEAHYHCGRPIYCTEDFLIYYRQQEFSTASLQERLKRYGLELPNHEITFTPRGIIPKESLNLDKIAVFGAFIESTQLSSVLAVDGTYIEGQPLYASPEIAKKLTAILTE
jgi:hypothetical protein